MRPRKITPHRPAFAGYFQTPIQPPRADDAPGAEAPASSGRKIDDGAMFWLSGIIGKENTLKMFEAFGGREFCFPKNHAGRKGGALKFAKIVAVIGEENAAKLCRELGGQRMYLSIGYRRSIEMRNRRIRADRDSGLTIGELIDNYHLTDRCIERIICPKKQTA